jgi:hypothetical protein
MRRSTGRAVPDGAVVLDKEPFAIRAFPDTGSAGFDAALTLLQTDLQVDHFRTVHFFGSHCAPHTRQVQIPQDPNQSP